MARKISPRLAVAIAAQPEHALDSGLVSEWRITSALTRQRQMRLAGVFLRRIRSLGFDVTPRKVAKRRGR
jgi:hypothetical protein